MPLTKRLSAEFIGTLWLVLGGCGSAVLATAYPNLGIGFAGVALAFGLTVLTMAYAVGHISGCHLNPAVTVGLWAGKRFPAGEILPYVIAQVLGAIAGAGILYLIATGKAGFSLAGGFAAVRRTGRAGGFAIGLTVFGPAWRRFVAGERGGALASDVAHRFLELVHAWQDAGEMRDAS